MCQFRGLQLHVLATSTALRLLLSMTTVCAFGKMFQNPLRPTPCTEALGTASKCRRAAKQSLALSIARDLDAVIDEEVDSIISINSDCNTPLDSPRTLAAEVVVNFDWCHVGDGRVGDLCEYLSDCPFSFARIFWQHDISGYLERQKTLMNGEPG